MRIVVVGIGGGSCSGKTILAKYLRRVLPTAVILHQDDFAPAIEDVPYSQTAPDIRDWDSPPTAIRWAEFRQVLAYVKQYGRLPDYRTHDHLNKQVEVGVDPNVLQEQQLRFAASDVIWVIVDGFIMFWDPEIVSCLDIMVFMRVPRELLENRREERQIYVLENGEAWQDPPRYFQRVVYPAYVKSHEHMFVDGDVEKGEVKPEWDVLVVSPEEGSMTRAFITVCDVLRQRS